MGTAPFLASDPPSARRRRPRWSLRAPTSATLGGVSLALAVALALGGCAPGEADLSTTPRDRTPPVETRSDAMTVRVDVDSWKQRDPDGLAPVWVEIVNRGTNPLDLRYGGFRFVGAPDDAVGAMPAQQLAGAAALEAIESDLAPLGRVEEGKEDSPRVLQGSGPTDPVEDVQGGYTERVPAIEDYQHNYWERFGPPTEDMYDQALREGVLEPGASRSGFLYFPRTELDAAEALAIELRPATASSDESAGSVRIEASLR